MSENKKLKGEIVILIDMLGTVAALLPERGYLNTEKWNDKDKGRESWTGGSQLTAAGSAKNNESGEEAMLREVDEELGEDVHNIIERARRAGQVRLFNRDENEERVVESFGVFLNDKLLSSLNYTPSPRGRKLINKDREGEKTSLRIESVEDFLNVIQKPVSVGALRPVILNELSASTNLKDYPKSPGVTNRQEIALFRDAKTSIEKAFATLVPVTT